MCTLRLADVLWLCCVVVVVVYSGYVVSNVRCAVDAAIVVVICAVCVFLVGWLA